MLPGGKTSRVFVPKESATPIVYQVRLINYVVVMYTRVLLSIKAVAKEIGLSESYMQFFSLFKIHDNKFCKFVVERNIVCELFNVDRF